MPYEKLGDEEDKQQERRQSIQEKFKGVALTPVDLAHSEGVPVQYLTFNADRQENRTQVCGRRARQFILVIFGLPVALFFLVVPVVMTLLGLIYRNSCPSRPVLPTLMMIGGPNLLLLSLCLFEFHCRKRFSYCLLFCTFVLSFVLLIGSLMGAMTTYATTHTSDPLSPNYCNKFFYEFSLCVFMLSPAIVGFAVGATLATFAVISLPKETGRKKINNLIGFESFYLQPEKQKRKVFSLA